MKAINPCVIEKRKLRAYIFRISDVKSLNFDSIANVVYVDIDGGVEKLEVPCFSFSQSRKYTGHDDVCRDFWFKDYHYIEQELSFEYLDNVPNALTRKDLGLIVEVNGVHLLTGFNKERSISRAVFDDPLLGHKFSDKRHKRRIFERNSLFYSLKVSVKNYAPCLDGNLLEMINKSFL